MTAGNFGWDLKRLLALACGVVLATTFSVASAVTVTFQQGVSGYTGAVDTYVDAGFPTTNNAAAVLLTTDFPPPTTDERQILIRFDNIFGNGAGQIPAGATINSATLTVNVSNSIAVVTNINHMKQTWADTITWNALGASPWNGTAGVQADDVEAVSTAAASPASVGTGSQAITVTSSLQTWSAAPATNFGWVLRSTGADSLAFDSSEVTTAANRPKLTVTYNEGGGGSATLLRQPYLQLGTPTSMTVCWRTDVATDSRVQYGTVQGTLDQTATSGTTATDHFVTINGLTAGTKYFYNVGSTTTVHGGGTANHYFKTSPTPGSTGAMRIWVVGDSGTGSSIQSNVMNAMLTVAGASPPDFALHVGDIAYNSGTDAEFTSNHFTPFANVLRNTVMWPSLGNHEAASVNTAAQSGPYYSAHVLPTAAQAGGVASGTEAYYSFDYGNAHFICLDSQDSSRASGGPMLTWLANDLAATTQQWLIAYWHHPPYSKGSHNSDSYGDSEGRLVDMRETVLPILEAAGVDLVLSGHSHSYERSYLIDRAYGFGSAPDRPTPSFATLNGQGRILDSGNGRPAPGGTGEYHKTSGLHPHEGAVYVVAGHGAQGGSGSLNHPVMYYSEVDHGSCIVDINGAELTLRNVRDTGTVSDTFKILKGQVPPRITAVTPTRDSTLSLLSSVAVTFSRPVSGVSPDDLTVNNSPATNVSGSGAGPYTFTGYATPSTGVVNVVVATGGIQDTGAPNLAFDGDSWTYTIDTNAPVVTGVSPPRNGTVSQLSNVSVTFSKPVMGVVASNMTVGGSPATTLSGVAGTAGPYIFSGYTTPTEGAVSVVLAAGAIVEVNGLGLHFVGDSWSYTLKAQLVINEFLASNNSVNSDPADGSFDDWLEIYNPGSQAVNMAGMFLTDDLDFPTQYQIPAGVTIPAGGYLVFWCDTTPGQGPLHTNFNISRTGEDLGLFDTIANGNQMLDGFTFPTQTTDVTSGRFPNGTGPIGVLASPTPGATNGGPPPAAGPLPIVAGNAWKYFKGTVAPPTEWRTTGFDDSSWASGNSGFGYGDNDDATVLSDMINSYTSVYVRRTFSIANPATITGLTLTVDYDDAFVAYLNGVEVARSASMGGTVGVQPAFNATAASGHECSVGDSTPQPADVININSFISQLQAGTNVLAIIGFNQTIGSSDLSLIPSLSASSVQCTGAGDCNDNNPCTVDSCSSGSCVHTPVSCPGGQTCNSSNGQCESTPVTVTFQQGVSGYTGEVDTYLDAGAPTTSHATTTPLIVDLAPNVNQILLRFDNIFGNGAGQIPAGATIQSATLTIDITNASAAGAGLYRMTQSWNDTDTWNTFSTGGNGIQAGTECLASADVSSLLNATGTHTITVTNSLQAWLANPATNHGWAWLPPAVDDSWQFDSAEGATASLRPKLSVTYVPAAGCTTNAQCDDGNPCTTDTCNSGTCSHTNNNDSCNDGNLCTNGDVCSGGACAGTPVSCPPGQTCNGTNGLCETAPQTVSFQDGFNSYSGTVDTYIESATPTTALGTVDPIKWDSSDGSPAGPVYLLLRFDNIFGAGAGQVPPGSTIQTATLQYTVGGDANAIGDDGDLREALTTWSESETYNSFGGDAGVQSDEYSGSSLATMAGGTLGSHSVSVLSSLQAWSAAPANNHGWIVLPTNTNGVQVRSREYATTPSERPKLTVTFIAGCQNASDCNDNNACTTDACNAGSCVNTPVSCDDGNPCTVDACDSVNGCSHTPIVCNDNNPCTTDTCVGGSCQFTPVANGTGCSDGNACNGAETCQAGACTPGTPPNCNDNNPCTIDSCDNINGCQHVAIANGTPCPNGTVCDGAETCQNGVPTAGTALTCDDGLFCNGAESCNAGTGCQPGTPPCSGLQQCDEAIDQCRNPRISCQLSSSTADAGTTVTMTVFLEDVRNVRGYQTRIAITPTSGSGTVSVNCPGGVSINESRPDYVFAGLGTTFPVTNCAQRRAASALLSGSATVNSPKYLATYVLTVSNDAAAGSTFDVSIMATPDSALTDASNQPIPFTVSSPCTLSVASGKIGSVTVNLTIPGLTGGPSVSNGQTVAQRSVEFLFTSCSGGMDARSVPVTFTRQGGNGVGQAVLNSIDTQATWLAVREGHSLRKRVPIDLTGDHLDTANITLTMGDFQTSGVPQDGMVDITDFAILAARFNTAVSDCMVADPSPQNCSLGADVTGDGLQDTPDFTAVQINFFAVGDSIDGCPPPLTDGRKPTKPVTGPITKAPAVPAAGLRSRVRVADLRMVPGVMSVDVNRDSVIDAADVRLFAQQHGLTLLPEFEQKLNQLPTSGALAPAAGQ